MIKIFDVICIGAVLIDMVARVDRYPEKDDEVFVSNLDIFSGGAAANTAAACAKLGLKTAFIGKLGREDLFRSKILDDFKGVKVHTEFLKYTDEFNTGSAFIALNKEGERRIYAYSGAANYLSKEDIIEKEICQANLLFLSSLKNIEAFIESAIIGKRNNIPLILNPGMLIIEQGLDKIKDLLKRTDILIMSQREFKALHDLKIFIPGPKEIKQESQKIFSLGVSVLIITMGRKGALIITKKNSELIPPLKIDKVVDTTGAGDAFSAGFIYGLIQKPGLNFENLKNNVRLGNYVAGKCIEKLGARNGIPQSEKLKFV